MGQASGVSLGRRVGGKGKPGTFTKALFIVTEKALYICKEYNLKSDWAVMETYKKQSWNQS